METRPLSGESRSGDSHVVAPFPEGILIGVVDGLGHGEDAGAAADRAVSTLGADPDQPVELLVKRCHQALRGTRGAVMSLASIDLSQRTMSWIGVGNVEAVLVRSETGSPRHREHIIARGGIVGYELPRLVASLTELHPSDVIVFATDGIRPAFTDTTVGDEEPRKIAARILGTHGLQGDDALVLVARVEEGAV